jgi:hypothetical protein
MKLNGKNLEEWFMKGNFKFPRNHDYKQRYSLIKEAAINIQKQIHQGNIESEAKKSSEKRISLTGHGPKHFEKVLKLVSDIVEAGSEITPYEAFLLSAIQIHDIGNIIDREGHQRLAMDVFYQVLPPNSVLDSVETNIIFSIAEVHTQNKDEDKDTISKLGDYKISYNDSEIRQQLLAAILKFADELADDADRAFMLGVKNNLVNEGSILHHVYSDSLKSTRIENKKAIISFKFDKTTAITKYKFDEKKVYLLDYIFLRNIKMHLERMYCQKFMRPDFPIDFIDIDITIYSDQFRSKLQEIKYRLLDKGYPEIDNKTKSIFKICEDPEKQLKTTDGNFWSGKILNKKLKQ